MPTKKAHSTDRPKPRTLGTVPIALIVAAWLTGCAALIVASVDGLRMEAALRRAFPLAKPDAFEFLDRLLAAPLGLVQITWLAVVAAAAMRRRFDVLAIAASGPLIALLMTIPFLDIADLHWSLIVGVSIIGCLVSTFFGGVWWASRRRTS